MRNVINTIANVTTNGIVRSVRTNLAGVDALRADSSRHLRLYAAPAHGRWTFDGDQAFGGLAAAGQPLSGKQKPEMQGQEPGGSDMLSRSCREPSRCRRPRVTRCLARS